MRSRALILIPALAALASPAAVRASVAGDRQVVAAIEARWLEHIADPAALDDILAEDFVHPLAQGAIIGKADQIAWARSHPSRPGRTARFERLDIRLYGDTAIATGIVEAHEAGAATPRRTLFTDVFVRRAGRWQAVNAQENPIPSGS